MIHDWLTGGIAVLWQINELVLLVVFLAGFLCAVEAGFWFGVRRKGPSIESDKAHMGAQQAAVPGVLALLLGFTFFMAVSRFDLRQSLVVDEAHAIGTAHLRVRFLPVERREAAEDLFRHYVAARLSFYSAGINPTQLEKANADATRIQRQLHVGRSVRVSIISPLNPLQSSGMADVRSSAA